MEKNLIPQVLKLIGIKVKTFGQITENITNNIRRRA